MALLPSCKVITVALAITLPALALADENDSRTKTRQVQEDTPTVTPVDTTTLVLQSSPSLIPPIEPQDIQTSEPQLIHFESRHNRFVGDVDIERFLRSGLWLDQRQKPAAVFARQQPAAPRDSESLPNPMESLTKNPVFNWSLPGLVQISLDVIASTGIRAGQTQVGATNHAVPVAPRPDSGKDVGSLGFFYSPQSSSVISPTAALPAQRPTAFSLAGYQLGLSSSLDLGQQATLGLDFGLGQALRRDLGDDESQRLTVTSLGIGLGHKRFRASVNSDVFLDSQGSWVGQQSTVGVQFDWRFNGSTLSVGARRPLVEDSGQAEQDFSSTIPYIRYRKEL